MLHFPSPTIYGHPIFSIGAQWLLEDHTNCHKLFSWNLLSFQTLFLPSFCSHQFASCTSLAQEGIENLLERLDC